MCQNVRSFMLFQCDMYTHCICMHLTSCKTLQTAYGTPMHWVHACKQQYQGSSWRFYHLLRPRLLQKLHDNVINFLLNVQRAPEQQSPLLSQQVACKIGESVPHGPSLHLLPTQVLHHIAGHHPNSYLIAREDGWIGQASVCLRVAASQAVQRQGGLREDSMVV